MDFEMCSATIWQNELCVQNVNQLTTGWLFEVVHLIWISFTRIAHIACIFVLYVCLNNYFSYTKYEYDCIAIAERVKISRSMLLLL